MGERENSKIIIIKRNGLHWEYCGWMVFTRSRGTNRGFQEIVGKAEKGVGEV